MADKFASKRAASDSCDKFDGVSDMRVSKSARVHGMLSALSPTHPAPPSLSTVD